jgi:hypothetical protein
MGDIEAKLALRELVDAFAVLADTKDVQQQVALFTAKALVETVMSGASVGRLSGTDAIGNAFSTFLRSFDTVYHFNGQHVVAVHGDRATGILYC